MQVYYKFPVFRISDFHVCRVYSGHLVSRRKTGERIERHSTVVPRRSVFAGDQRDVRRGRGRIPSGGY